MKIEIWSDVVCPWCYIGRARFEKALAQFDGRDEVEITWRSFQLDPDAPQEYPKSINHWLVESKGIRLEQAQGLHDRLAEMGQAEGLDYRFDLVRTGNTFDAHRLVHLAARQGLASEMTARLQRAYFTEGQAVGDLDTLVKLAAEVGLDAAEARRALEGGAFAAEVRADLRHAEEIGVTGVPCFVIDEKYAITGAQPDNVILRALDHIRAEEARLMAGS